MLGRCLPTSRALFIFLLQPRCPSFGCRVNSGCVHAFGWWRNHSASRSSFRFESKLEAEFVIKNIACPEVEIRRLLHVIRIPELFVVT